MGYTKTYITMYKSNIVLLHVKPHFYFDRLPWSFCVFTVYDASFLK